MAADTSIATIDTQAVSLQRQSLVQGRTMGPSKTTEFPVSGSIPTVNGCVSKGNRNPVDPEATDLVIAGNAPTALETTLGDVVV